MHLHRYSDGCIGRIGSTYIEQGWAGLRNVAGLLAVLFDRLSTV